MAAALLGVLTACSGVGTVSSEEPSRSAPVPANAVPDDTPAVTDAPRPSGTDVVLSFAEWDEAMGAVSVGGYASPVVEDGGTCTAELAQDDRTVEVSAAGLADATTTICSGLSLLRDELSPGVWTVVLRYDSGTTSGISEPIDVEVPS